MNYFITFAIMMWLFKPHVYTLFIMKSGDNYHCGFITMKFTLRHVIFNVYLTDARLLYYELLTCFKRLNILYVHVFLFVLLRKLQV
jgi:hypothetical protein